MYVIKRDGTRVLFDINKIVNAVNKAMIAPYVEMTKKRYWEDEDV